MSLVRSIVSGVTGHKNSHFLTLGLVFTLWTASSGFAAIIDGLDVVYRVRETRGLEDTAHCAWTDLVGGISVAPGCRIDGGWDDVGNLAWGQISFQSCCTFRLALSSVGDSDILCRPRSGTPLPFRTEREAALPG